MSKGIISKTNSQNYDYYKCRVNKSRKLKDLSLQVLDCNN